MMKGASVGYLPKEGFSFSGRNASRLGWTAPDLCLLLSPVMLLQAP